MGGENIESTSFLFLPDDVVILLFSYCDLQTLGRLACSCKRFAKIIKGDCIWRRRLRQLTRVKCYMLNAFAQLDSKQSLREQYRIARNWSDGSYKEVRVIHHGIRQMPWMQLDGNQLWISNKNIISCYGQRSDGRLQALPLRQLTGHVDDVARFVAKDDFVIGGTREGDISVFRRNMDQPYVYMRDCHSGDVHSVDIYGDIIVSGSRDTTVKLWCLASGREGKLLRTIAARDRVWSVAMNPSGSSFVTGSAGLKQIPPLRIWDIERGELLANLGSNYKNGAGILDMQYETSSVLFTGGYDTIVRCWDLRASHRGCVMKWEEPFDSAIYCLKSDGGHCLLTGTARHGMVRLWDKRRYNHVQHYYTGKTNSPVYCLAFDSSHLYAGLDKGIYLLDFACTF